MIAESGQGASYRLALGGKKKFFVSNLSEGGKIPGMTRAEKSGKRKSKPLTNPLLPFCPGLNCIRYLPLEQSTGGWNPKFLSLLSTDLGGGREESALSFFATCCRGRTGGGNFSHSPGDPIFPSFSRLEKIKNKSADEGKKREGKRKDLSR